MQLEIELTQKVEDQLRLMAVELGYDSAEVFVAECLTALVDQPVAGELAPMSPAELAASLELIDKSMAQIDAGEGLTIEEARERLLSPLREQAG